MYFAPEGRELTAAEREAKREADEDLLWLLSEKRGRRILYRLLDGFGLWGGSYVFNAPATDSGTFYLEGRRSAGIDLMRACQRLDPERYALTIGEAMAAFVEKQAAATARTGEETDAD